VEVTAMRRLAMLCTLVLSGLTLVAGSASARQDAPLLDKIDYATSFGNFGRDAYVYVAIEKGYFAQANLDVSVTSGPGSVDNMKFVAAGRLDYAPVDIGALVVTRANEGVPVRTISVVHQNTMSAILSLQESNIRRPADLVGKTLADSPASTVRVLFPLYARKAGIDPNQVRWRDAAPPALPALLAAKQVDGIGQFVVGRPLVATAAQKPVAALRYSDFLPGLLGIGIIASDEKIRSNPGEVRRFTRAINRGLKYAIDNPNDAARILKKYQPLVNEQVAAQELRIMKFFVETQGARKYGIGYIDPQKMKATTSVVASGFRLGSKISYRDIYAGGFVKTATFKPANKT
jgi:NitT/TauT family transport system substrate-binding protein